MFDMSALRVNTKHTDGFSRALMAVSMSFLEFIRILERPLIDLLLHEPPEIVISQIEVRAVGGHRSGETKSVWGFARSNSSSFCAPMHCPTSDTFDSRKY